MTGRLVLALVCVAACLASMPSFAENFVIHVTNQSFEPSEVTIKVGDTVTFQKDDTAMAHNVQSDGFGEQCAFGPTCFRCAVDGCQGQGGSGDVSAAPFSFTLSFFDLPGTFGYFCQPHRAFGMTGRIIVQEGAPPPPPPTNSAGTIRFTNAQYDRAEGVGSAAIQVERKNGDDGAVGVTYESTSGGSATSGGDFTPTSGTLSWADGESGVKTFSLQIVGDTIDEADETVKLTLKTPTGGATLSSPSTATVSIIDDDVATGSGTIEFTSALFSVAETAAHATVTVSRTGSALGAASVDYETSNGTATAGQDYTSIGGSLDWGAGDTADKSFQVPILDDLANEASETISVSLSQPVGATIGSPTAATLTIFDDESVPPCTDGDFQVCLIDRFLVRVHWMRNNGASGEGKAIKLTDASAAFEFFEPGNTELVAKIRDNGCGLAPGNPLRNFWVFVAGLTNVRIELTIIDTESGAVRRFYNALGQPFFTPALDSPDGTTNPPGAIQATTEALGAFPTCDL